MHATAACRSNEEKSFWSITMFAVTYVPGLG